MRREERGYFMVRIIKSGRVTEKVKFWVSPNTKIRKGRKKGATTARKQDVNERDGEKRLARKINCNFSKGDFLLGFTYDELGIQMLLEKAEDATDMNQVWAAANNELSNLMKRIKRELDKMAIKPKYIALTADIDGATGEIARIHHHVVISGEGISVQDKQIYIGKRPAEEIWKYGAVDYKGLWDQEDYTPLAQYLWKQVRRQPAAKKYKPSRNLSNPVLVLEEKQYTDKELATPKGAKLLHRNQYEPGMPQYMRYIAQEDRKSIVDRQPGQAKPLAVRSGQKARE